MDRFLFKLKYPSTAVWRTSGQWRENSYLFYENLLRERLVVYISAVLISSGSSRSYNNQQSPLMLGVSRMYVDCSESKERLPMLISYPITQPSMLIPTTLHFDVFVMPFRTAAEANLHVALFWYMTMHAQIPPGRHRPCCMMNSIGAHLTILPTVRTWHHRTFTSFWRWRSTLLVNDLQMMRT